MLDPGPAAGPAAGDRSVQRADARPHSPSCPAYTPPTTTTTGNRPVQHQRALTEDHRRPSLVQLRSRSNTSAASYDVNNPSGATSTQSSPRLSTARTSSDRPKSMLQKAEHKDRFRRGLKAKSSRLFKRPDNRDDLTSLGPLHWSSEVDDICPKAAGPGRWSPTAAKRSPRSPTDARHRYHISEPFNFQHLTHTDPSHFQRMRAATTKDIVSEFSALRASQAPCRQLQGIKAQDLSGLDDLESTRQTRDRLQHNLYVPPSPSLQSESSTGEERFPLPVSTASSVNETELMEETRNHTNCGFHADPSDENATISAPASVDVPIAIWADGVYNFSLPHAVTTPDDVAHILQPPPPFHALRSELSQVPEEDESPDRERRSLIRPPGSVRPISALRPTKSFPASGHSPQKINVTSAPVVEAAAREDRIRPSSVFEQPANDIPVRPRSCEPSGDVLQEREASWEDDIDWCYQHEAEADCNFDWNRNSAMHGDLGQSLLPSAFTVGAPVPLPNYHDNKFHLRLPRTHHRSSSSIYSTSPALRIPLRSDVPDLEPPSAISAQSSFDNVSEAVTPVQGSSSDLKQQFLTASCKPACQDWVDHAAVTPQRDADSTMIYEDHFHMIFARKSLPDHAFSTEEMEASTSESDSARSSHSLLTKSSSQESFWSRRDHRSDSGGSVPELTHCRISRDSDKRGWPVEQIASYQNASSIHDAGLGPIFHRRNQSLAKDVAQKTILTKVVNRDSLTAEIVPSPSSDHFGQETRASDSNTHSHDMWSTPFPIRPYSDRSRSSNFSYLSGKKTSSSNLMVEGVQT